MRDVSLLSDVADGTRCTCGDAPDSGLATIAGVDPACRLRLRLRWRSLPAADVGRPDNAAGSCKRDWREDAREGDRNTLGTREPRSE